MKNVAFGVPTLNNEVFDVLVNRVSDIRDVKTRVPGIRYEA